MKQRVLGIGAVLLALLLAAQPADAKKKKKTDKEADEPKTLVQIQDWLVLGPVRHPLPVFHSAAKAGVKTDDLLESPVIDPRTVRPRVGESRSWFGVEDPTWAQMKAGSTWSAPDAEQPALAYAFTTLTNDRWCEVEISVSGSHPRHLWVDGVSAAKGSGESVKKKLALERGRHDLLIQSVYDPEAESDWQPGLQVNAVEDGVDCKLSAAPSAPRSVEMRDVTDAPNVSSMALSPDGQRLVMSVARIVPGTHDRESWVELRDVASGQVLQSWRGQSGARSVAWSPDGRYLSFAARAASGEGASDLFLHELESGATRPLLQGVERMGRYNWSPDSKGIFFSTSTEGKEFKEGIKLLEGLRDRWSSFRNKSHINLVSVPDGIRRQVTAGAEGASLAAMAPSGKRILFTRSLDDLTQRPYTRTELWELDLATFESEKIRDFRWFNGVEFSPTGDKLLVAAQPAEFGDAGLDLSEDRIPNSYDSQLFIWDPVSDEVQAISKDFDPSIGSFEWSRADGQIYITASDRDFTRLYRFDPASETFSAIDTGVDAFGSLQLAHNAPVAVGTGTSPWEPQKLIVIDLSRPAARELPHPNEPWFAEVRGGSLKEWNFDSATGKTIEGRYYLPPNFDASKKYPLIVYYYGGTSPTGRGFGGRYPKEWWSANGYVVYVLQPSGATGFGQDFSARHVNDWGKTSSEEIIEGTKKFLAAHSFADPDRVGCIGASYGGFMTMLLSTKSDVFSAAVAHAGISSISSYWGEGYWGYLYSSVATAESFPWNRKDIYVDQSPLFRADQNRVPLLLTHGASDTNVPVGESDQFYIALKLLGKDVEYIQVEGEDHWILDHAKRHLWSKSILAFFDRHLKKEPQWWEAMYPVEK